MHGVRIVFLIFLSGLVRGLDYSHLEALGVTCPERDKCAGYRLNSRPYTDRNCECDNACTTYGDCCIDANNRRRSSSARTVMPSDKVCLNYGEDKHTGVYAVARCSSGWDGLRQVRRKCEGSPDFSDPMSAAPVTSVSQAVTYKNLFCAECNNADMQSLTTFQFRLSCEGLEDLSQAQIVADLFYDQQRATWGVNRLTDDGATNFVGCEILFEVPSYVNSSLRFCKANVVSTCTRDWTRTAVRSNCEQYMAVVYDHSRAYRNPDCAICNRKTVDDVSCRLSISGRKKPQMSLPMIFDINLNEGDRVGITQVATPQCPSAHKYDPFIKKCRKLACAFRGHQVVNGRCVPGGS